MNEQNFSIIVAVILVVVLILLMLGTHINGRGKKDV